MANLSGLVEWIKLSPRYLLPLLLFTGFVLFAPSSVLSAFGLVGFVSDYRPWFGAAFLLSATLLISAAIAACYGRVIRWRRQAQREKYMRRRLHHLSEPEKEILRGYIEWSTRTRYLPMHDGVVGGLEVEHIIFRSSNFGDLASWAYNVQPWAWEYLNENPKLLS